MAQENDVVLIYFEDEPMAFARIEQITPDAKPEWFQVRLLLFQVPLQVVTWILRPAYINGEPFTMGGKQMRLEKVVCPELETPEEKGQDEDTAGEKKEKKKDGKVVNLFESRKKD
jgi:hypothetical protein